MASAPRRWSKELPPDLSDLMNKLIEYAASFIRGFDLRESEMRKIVREFKEIADRVREMQKITDVVRKAGTAVLAVGILGAVFNGGLSLAVVATGAGGGATVVTANVTKGIKENGSAKKVEELGKQFMEKVEPLKKILEEIKTTCEKLELMTPEVHSENILTDMEELQRILRRVSELRKSSGKVLDVTVMVMQIIDDLVGMVINVIRVTATPEEDKKLTQSIIQSADQCQKVFDNFDKMKKELKDFRETE